MEKCNTNILCDRQNCTNTAKYRFAVKGRMRYCNLCESCMQELYREIAEHTVPRSPQNKIKKTLDAKTTVKE